MATTLTNTAKRSRLLFAVVSVVFAALSVAPQALRPVHAQSHAPSLQLIDVQGLRRLDGAAALAHTKLRTGEPADAAAISADLQRMWKTGFFSDVEAWLEPVAGGVQLHWWVQEKPSIRRIELRGHDALSEDDIKAALDLKAFTILNTEALNRNAEKVRALYVTKGYFLAHVGARVQPVPQEPSEVDVIFDIREQDKVSVRGITFLGNTHVSSAELAAAMQTRVGHELSWLTQAGTYKEEFLQTDVLRLQALYFDRGFVTVKVAEPQTAISADRKHIYITIAIQEGEPYDIGDITYAGDVRLPAEPKEGLPGLDAETLQRHVRLRSKDRFNRSKLFEDVQTLTDMYRDRGYAYANVTPNSVLHPEQHTVDIELEVERGEEVFIERIDMVGNSRTRDKVLRRELALVEGQRFDGAALNLSRSRLFQLGFFETVNLVTQPGSEPNSMIVAVEVKEKSTGTFQIGAGFSSLESFIATAQISQNNFLGNGQSLSLSMQLSFGAFARQLASFQFFEPYFLDTPWALGVNAYLQQRFYRDFQRNAVGFAPTLGYPLTHNLRLSGGYTLENVKITAENAATQAVLYNLNRNGRVSSVNSVLAYDTRDNRLLPSRGMYHELRFEWSSPALGAQPQMAFKRSEIMARFYAPIIWGVVFRLNLQMGWVFGAPDGSVPISERYFPGGIYSVRGFEPRALGPSIRVAKDARAPASGTRDFIIGGNKQVILNVELEFPIVPAAQLKGVVFVDAGNAYNDDESFFFAKMPHNDRAVGYLMGSKRPVHVPAGLFYSFGFGVRWFSPIGPLRFEWGIPITKRMANDRDLVFEFTIGNFF